jgi:phage baseplate assembly protein W
MGLGVKLPLVMDDDDGAYLMSKTYEELAQQNLKMLILTNPGERTMDMFFGVGLRNYLFENNDGSVYADISAKVNEQVARYMSYIEIQDIKYENVGDETSIDENFLNMTVYFKIIPLDLESQLSIVEPLS